MMEPHRIAVGEDAPDEMLSELPPLGPEQHEALQRQGNRLVPEARAAMAIKDSARHWDIFYKRNGDRFFKDRHWIVREFPELLELKGGLLEAGCGAGALLFPLSQVTPGLDPLLACDLSPRAVGLVQANPLYEEPRMKAFQADLCTPTGAELLASHVAAAGEGLSAVTAIFLLSALSWEGGALQRCVGALAASLRPGGLLLLRDYARHDMAQIRFGPGHKISDNLYLRQDGTTSYFFTCEEIRELLTAAGLREVRCGYVQRRTTNVKEELDLPRTFLQACFSKPR